MSIERDDTLSFLDYDDDDDRDNGFYIDDDELITTPLFPTSLSSLDNKDLKNILRLLNINIEVYNTNSKKFIKFITTLADNLETIESNVKNIFSAVTKLRNYIVVENNNYDMVLGESLKDITEKYYIRYLGNLENILTALWRFSEETERAHKRYARFLKKTSWCVRNGHLDLKIIIDDGGGNNEMSTFVIKQRGVRDICGLVYKELLRLKKK